MIFSGDQTLQGTGEIFFGGNTTQNRNAVDSGGTLTIGPGITIRGTETGSVGNTFTIQTIILEGTILAESPGETIVLGGLGTQIRGLVRATSGGTVSLVDSFSFQGTGTFQAIGGSVILGGTLDNTGKTLALSAATGSLQANNGTIKGGRVETSGGAVLVPAFTLTLDGVTLGSDFTVPDGTDVLVSNGLTLDNIDVTFTDGTVIGSPRMRFTNTGTLAGTGEVIFGGTGDNNQLVGTSGQTFTIGPNITIHGTQGGTVGLSGNLVNQGVISSETNPNQITVSGTTVSNQGTLQAINGGDILLSGSFTNTGQMIIGASGSVLRLLSGTILQNSGMTTMAGGTLQATTVSLQGGVLSGSGTVTGAVINNATVTIGGTNAAGTLQINGSYTQTAAGVLNMEIGGLTQGTQFDRLVSSGAGTSATLAGTLNLSTINGFSPSLGQNFQILAFVNRNNTVFTTVNGTALPNGLFFTPQYNLTNLTLSVTNVGPATAAIATAGANTDEEQAEASAGLGLAYVQQSWVRDFVSAAEGLLGDDPNEGIAVELPVGSLT